MGKYGLAAVAATTLVREGRVSEPNEAWELAVRGVFPGSKASQAKGCPRGAYLGLCEEGLVVGVPPGSYCRSVKNKEYALRAVTVLMSTEVGMAEEELWLWVTQGEKKAPNHQMDVVLSLWRAGYIDAARLRSGQAEM